MKLGALLGLIFCFVVVPAKAADVVLRHNLSGPTAGVLIELVERFNSSSKRGKVLVEHLSMVTDPRRLPHMALLDEDQYMSFFDSRPRMKPVDRVLASAGVKLRSGQLYPGMADVVHDAKGRILALPLALSVPVLYYNKDAFRKAGLDPDRPPRTWWQVQDAAGRLLDAGHACPFTSSHPAWVHVENLATQHGEAISWRQRNGRTEFSFNGMVYVKHLALLASWYKSRYFHYFGRGKEADEKFLRADCSMLTGASSLYARMREGASFKVGVADLPYYDDVRNAAPGRLLPDGAALWVLAGRKAADYKLVARFLAFLIRPEIQREWVAATGFLPMMPAAAGGRGSGTPQALRDAVDRLAEKRFLTAARLKVLPGFERVRSILYEELEDVWANRKPAKEALDNAVTRGNAALRKAPLQLPMDLR